MAVLLVTALEVAKLVPHWHIARCLDLPAPVSSSNQSPTPAPWSARLDPLKPAPG